MPTWIALTFLALVVLGLLLVVFGWRGRRINNHPVCRQCRFDLDGIRELVTCPECGAGLKRPGSTRRGVRKRMWSAVTVGALMVLLPGSAIGVVLFAALTGVDSAAYKPVWLLTFEARHGSIAQVKAAGAELLARDQRGRLSESERERAVETGLLLQADLSRPWDPASWGDLLDRALGSGDLTEEQRVRFLANSFTLKFIAREAVTVGGVLPVVVEVGQSRTGTATQFMASLSGYEAETDGRALERVSFEQWQALNESQVVGSSQFGFQPGGAFGYVYCYARAIPGATGPVGGGVLNLYVPEDFPIGRVSVDVLVHGALESDLQKGFRLTQEDLSKREFERSASFDVDVRPADDELIELFEPTDEMRQAVRDVLASTAVQVYPYDEDQWMLQMLSQVDELDIDVAFYVTATWDDESVNLGIVTNGKNEPDMGAFGGSSRFFGGYMDSYEVPDSITLTFEPDVRAARGTVDLTSIYGEKVIIEDIRVEDQAGFVTRGVSSASQSDDEESEDP